MNINGGATRVLCYGDSNTWGYVPGSGKRFSSDIRWTGVLQSMLGNGYEIIEEGLNGRTTDIIDPRHNGMSGLDYFLPCLRTHLPVDIIVVFLGSNDLKHRFNRSAVQISEGMEKIVKSIKLISSEENYVLKDIILVCPPIVDESVAFLQENFKGAKNKSTKLPAMYRNISVSNGCKLLNLQGIVRLSDVDGFHLSRESHSVIAHLLDKLISS